MLSTIKKKEKRAKIVIVGEVRFEPAMDVDTILDREYNMVGGAEVIELHQLIFEFGAIA